MGQQIHQRRWYNPSADGWDPSQGRTQGGGEGGLAPPPLHPNLHRQA